MEAAGLLLALAFVFVMAYLPHLATSDRPPAPEASPWVRLGTTVYEWGSGSRDIFPYPIHVDEHLHWVFVKALLQQEKVALERDPYTGDPTHREGFFSLKEAVHEQGFRLIVAQIHSVTGVPFLELFQYLPALWLAFTAFGMYAALRPHPAAVPAAAFVALIPTTVRFLGPGFLVPIGFVLAWLPAALILAEPAKRFAGGAALLALVVAWGFFVHLIGGFAAVALLAVGGIFGGARNLRATTTLLIITAAPILWLYRAFAGGVRGELQREEFLPVDFTIFDNIGLTGLFAWSLGVAIYTQTPRENKSMALTAFVGGSVAMMALIVLGVILDWGRYATYARWHPPFFLAAAVPFGFGVAATTRALRRWLARPYRGRRLSRHGAHAVSVGIGLVLIAYFLAPGIDKHIDERYYRVMSDADWSRFNYVSSEVGPEYQVFLTHPWKAPILLAMSGKIPHAVLYPGEPPFRGEAWDDYVRTGGTLEFYILNDVSLVVATGKPPLPEFIELGHEGVYGLRPDIAQELAQIRARERGEAG